MTSASTYAVYPTSAAGTPGATAAMVAVAPVEPGDLRSVNPSHPRARLLHLDEPVEREQLQGVLDEHRVVYEDSKRDTAALLRAGLRVPESYDDLRLMVHVVDEGQSWSHPETGEWLNAIRALAGSLCRDVSLLGQKEIKKLGQDTAQRDGQVRLHADYLGWLFTHFRGQLNDDAKASEVYQRVDLPLVPVIRSMEETGVGCDVDGACWFSAATRDEQDRLLKLLEPHAPRLDIADDINIRKVVYQDWKLQPVAFTRTRKPAVTEKALFALRDRRVNTLVKARQQRTLLQQLQHLVSGRLHGELHIAGSVSGRVYTRRPNLVGLSHDLRSLIVPAEGHVLIIVDYSQMELRVLAALTRDPRLVTRIRDGVDLHAAMAASIYRVPVEHVTDDQRSVGKTVNFAIIFGQTWHGLSEDLGIPAGEAMNMLVAHQRLYPHVWAWRKRMLEEARQNGGLLRTWIVGRRRCLPSLCGGSPEVVEKSERKIINHQVQSLAADIVKMRLRRIYDAVGSVAWPVLFAHDEVVLECPENHAADVLHEVVRIVEKPVDAFCVPLKVKAVVGRSWADKP